MPEFQEEDRCFSSPDGKHAPDWESISSEWDGDEEYVDVCCVFCGRSGCLGNVRTLTEHMCW